MMPKKCTERAHSIHLMIFAELIRPTQAIEKFMCDDHSMIKIAFFLAAQRARKNREPNDETFPLIIGNQGAGGWR